MKKVFTLLVLIFSISKGFSQNIGINATGATPHSSAMLDVSSTTKGMLIPRMTSAQRTAIATPATGLIVYDTDNNSFWVYNGPTLGWGQVNYWANTGFNSTDIYNTNSGKVGIGTNTPITKLSVKTLTNDYGVTQTDGTITVGTYVGAGEGWIGTRSNHPLTFFTNNGGQAVTLATNGFFGIGNNSPANRLELGKSPFSGADFAIGSVNGIDGMAFTSGSSSSVWSSTKDILIYPATSSSNAHLGIGTVAAANKLQIGNMGPTGFSGNDLAIGNGTNATGFFQSNSFLQVASSTDIALLPNINNGSGRVGINTTTPRAPLEVDGNVGVLTPNGLNQWAYYTLGFNNFNPVDAEGGASGNIIPNVSIIASNRILASEFDAYSDARIKNIIGISHSAKDLATVKAFRVTDYTMKDKVKYGNAQFKKVIAQQVEKVYPQVVSKHTDFIPNVYQLASRVKKVDDGYQLSFVNKHNISRSAKKLQVLLPGGGGMKEVNIVSIPSGMEVIVNASELDTDKIFVYGEEVNDFRTVDYEGLTTLNISATQELSKLFDKQNKRIEAMEKEIRQLQSKKD